MKKKSSKGFTLVELIVVIAILAILALILVPTITNYIDMSNESKNIANTRMLYTETVLSSMDEDMDREAIRLKLEGLVPEGDKVQIDTGISEVRYVPKSGKVVIYDGHNFTLTNKAATD